MQIAIYDHCHPQSQLYQRWTDLAQHPLETPGWLMSWWRAYGQTDPRCQLCLVTLSQQGRLMGLAPLYRRDRSLHLLGDGTACTDHLGLLIGTTSLDAHRQIVQWLASEQSECGSTFLESVDDGTPTQQVLGQSQLPTHRLAVEASCCIDLPDSWEAYLHGLSKNHRKKCRRWQRKYFDTHRAQCLSTLSTSGDGASTKWSFDEAFTTLIRLHADRHHGREGGAFSDSRFVQFLHSAFDSLSHSGQVEISGLSIDGIVQAVEFELHSPQTTFAYQSGLASSGLPNDAGCLSLMSRIRTAIGSGKTRFDLMRGTESYKYHWGARTVKASSYRLRKPTLLGHAARSADHLRSYSKQLVRGIAGML